MLTPGSTVKLCMDYVNGAKQLGFPTEDAFITVKACKISPFEVWFESSKGYLIIPRRALDMRPDGTLWLEKWYKLPPHEMEIFYSIIREEHPVPTEHDTDNQE